jgi:hypothetical protein
MTPSKVLGGLDAPLARRRRFFVLGNGIWRSAEEFLARWRSADIEDTVHRHGGTMSDNFEREITQRIGRSQGL